MKLIIKQYLDSLKERGELDAILPDLLSQMGLNVISRPRIGTSQHGVDVAAVGCLDGGEEKVYLFSVKSGDLTRSSWDGLATQSLRPSLNEIQDAYIPNRLPPEHRNKQIVICLCFGGEIQEQARSLVTGYINDNTKDNLEFQEWNGDKLADLILSYFLKEDLLPSNSRPLLRKALALLDEPESSFVHFSNLVRMLALNSKTADVCLRTMRQLSICLWVLFAWSRDAGNIESAYLSAERTLLYTWELSKGYFPKKSKIARSIKLSFGSILHIYQLICKHFITGIIPHVNKKHALSNAVQSSCKLDVNLKLFDLLGRMALTGVWSSYLNNTLEDDEFKQRDAQMAQTISHAIKSLISNNPMLLMPFKDDQAIDIFLALLFLSYKDENKKYMLTWLNEVIDRAIFTYKTHGDYPCVLQSYKELLTHPKIGDEEYRQEVTAGSILYPIIAFWAAILGDKNLFGKVIAAKQECLEHCNFQIWYPDEMTEEHLYINSELHGETLTDIPTEKTPEEFLEFLWKECCRAEHFQMLTSIKHGFWPLVLVACRHYRIPVPIHFCMNKDDTL